MSKTLFRYIEIFIMSLIFYYLNFEMVSMMRVKFDEATSNSSVFYFTTILFFLLLFLYFFRHNLNLRFQILFSVCLFYIVLITLLHLDRGDSVYHSFYLVVRLILPILLFQNLFNAASYIDSKTFNIYVVVGILYMLYNYNINYQYVVFNQLFAEDEFRTSANYIFLYLGPLLFLSNNKLIKYGSMIIVTVLLVTSLKRGGMICLGFISYYIVNEMIQKKSDIITKALKLGAIFIFFVIVAVYANEKMGGVIFERFASILSDKGSGRDKVYKATFDLIINTDFTSFLFGHGWNSVVLKSKANLSAHNDLLEVLYDFGVFALLLYLFVWIELVKYFRSMIRRNSKYAPVMAFTIVSFLVNSMVAHVLLYPSYIASFAIVWGYIIGKDYQTKNYIK